MTKQLRVCVIGGGSIASFHLAAYANNPQVELYGMYDASLERAEQRVAEFGMTRAYASLEELWQDDTVDAVSICTWNDTHAELTMAAIAHGKDVLVEKPVALTYAQAQQMERVAADSDRIVQVGFVRRFGTNMKVLQTFLEAQTFGDIYYAKGTYLRRLGNPGGWFADASRSGGGPLIDLGVHLVDTLWYAMGRPQIARISAATFNALGNRANVKNLAFYQAADYDASLNTVEDLAVATLHFTNGATMVIDTSFTLHAAQDEVQMKVFGTTGGAEIEPALTFVTEQHDTILNVTPQIDHPSFDFDNAFQAEIDHFVESCLARTTPLAPLSDGVAVMQMLDGIYRSAATGKEVVFE